MKAHKTIVNYNFSLSPIIYRKKKHLLIINKLRQLKASAFFQFLRINTKKKLQVEKESEDGK